MKRNQRKHQITREHLKTPPEKNGDLQHGLKKAQRVSSFRCWPLNQWQRPGKYRGSTDQVPTKLMTQMTSRSDMKTLAEIQSLIKAPKGQFNSFGKYKYRSAEDILEAVKVVINPLGYWITLSDELIQVGDRYYIKSTATLTDGTNNYHSTAFAREEESKKGMDGSQVTGASSSYARKYALNGLFAIDDTKDSDATNTHDEPKNPALPSSGDKFEKAKKFISEGGAVEDIEKKYYLTDAVKNLLIAK